MYNVAEKDIGNVTSQVSFAKRNNNPLPYTNVFLFFCLFMRS